jgi:hypothetical protein
MMDQGVSGENPFEKNCRLSLASKVELRLQCEVSDSTKWDNKEVLLVM